MNIQCVRFAAALLVAMALALPSGVLAERRVRTTPLTLVDASGTTMGVFYPSFIQWGYQDIDTQTTSVVVLDLGLSVGPVALPVAPTGAIDTDLWPVMGVDGTCHDNEFAGHWTLPPADVVLPLTFAPPFRAR